VTVEIGAVVPITHTTYLPTDALVMRGPAIVAFEL
jgi:hypothetical protein